MRALHGAFTVAVTNDTDSELASSAEAVLPLSAGAERAVAATKTYLNQVAALALLAGHCGGQGRRVADGIRSVADQIEHALPALEEQAQALALPFVFVGRMFVIGRGPEFATAREIALKLLETCKTAAWPLTATDLAHGPVAVLDPLFPVWAIASRDQTLRAVQEAVARVRDFGSTVVASGNAAAAIDGRGLRPARARARHPAALAAPLGRARAALRVGARPGEGLRPRPPARPVEDHPGALTTAAPAASEPALSKFVALCHYLTSETLRSHRRHDSSQGSSNRGAPTARRPGAE